MTAHKGNDHSAVLPILVVLVWRGGKRFERALTSIRDCEQYFSRVILSITSEQDSPDVQIARDYLANLANEGFSSKAEIICTGEEFPTMKHQKFWIEYLESTGAKRNDWIFWLAYDDQLRLKGIKEIVDRNGNWRLAQSTIYLGPWSIRHESSIELWHGLENEEEIWTCLPKNSGKQIPVLNWISSQITQPTYLQMSGSVAQLDCHSRLIRTWPKKRRPMRIEMATAAHFRVHTVTEFVTAPTFIYGRSDSDRAAYGRSAYWEDLNLALRVLKDAPLARRPLAPLFRALAVRVIQIFTRKNPREEWRKYEQT